MKAIERSEEGRGREGGRARRERGQKSLTLWEVLEDTGDAALGEQENVAVSLGPHCATAGDIVNQVDLGREGEGEEEEEGGRERERGGGGGGE